MMKIFALFIIILWPNMNLLSQISENDFLKLVEKSQAFIAPRENIHLHLNKSTYISHETIWFKGYIINKITGRPIIETTNVYVELLNEKYEVIKSHLVLANNGFLEGYIHLTDDFSSGKYFIHTYTNYMNNFEEDESSLFKIDIINADSPFILSSPLQLKNASMEVHVEGGHFTSDCDHIVVVSLKDCSGNGIRWENLKVYDQYNSEVSSFNTNSKGYGSFKIYNNPKEIYKVVLNTGSFTIEKALPHAQETGMVMSVNNHLLDKKILLLDIKTNEKTFEKVENKNYALIIQKNEKMKFFAFDFLNISNKIQLTHDYFFEGINYIRLVDDQLNLISERLVYSPLDLNEKIQIQSINTVKDTVIVKGKMSKAVNISMTVLPDGHVNNFENSVQSNFIFSQYLKSPVEDVAYYLDDYSRVKQFELDLVLMQSAEAKYNWDNFKNPKSTLEYPFENGLDLIVSINQDLSKTKESDQYYATILSTTYPIYYKEAIDVKNTVVFKNTYVRDSTTFFINITKNEKAIKFANKLYTRTMPKKGIFLKRQSFIQKLCENSSILTKPIEKTELEFFKKPIILDDIEIKDKKVTLKYENLPGNRSARVYKQSADQDHLRLIDILLNNGYDAFLDTVTRNLQVFNIGLINPAGGPTKPVIFIDDFRLLNDFSILNTMQSNEIDEIYFNRYDLSVPSSEGIGTIKIYRKKEFVSYRNTNENSTFFVANGFQRERAFQNPYLFGFDNPSFKKYGIIHWIPNISVDANGYFECKFPKLGQDKVMLNIQGIDDAGILINEEITLDLINFNKQE